MPSPVHTDSDTLILAGDIGGTKTVLALFSWHQPKTPLAMVRFASGQYDSFEAIVAEFLQQTGMHPKVASFGVAGPIEQQRARITNLPWTINAETIGETFSIANVSLLNDLQATATALPLLQGKDLAVINQGIAIAQGPLAVIAPGTGLGFSFSTWNGTHYQAHASEGGHSSFAPQTPLEMELLRFLQKKYGHVSFERVCSGKFLPNILDFFMEQEHSTPSSCFRKKLEEAEDPTPVIIQLALNKEEAICTATLDLFIQILATFISNMALTLLPTGGIYLGGGIAPRILTRLQQPDFVKAMTKKGRFSSLLAGIPVHAILDPHTPLYGAACHVLNMMKNTKPL